MMQPLYLRIKDRIDAMALRPRMFAITKEAYVCELATLLFALGDDKAGWELGVKFLCRGNTAIYATDPLTEEFAALVIAEVRKRFAALLEGSDENV